MFAALLKKLSWKRLAVKIIRQEGSPESIAKGVCIGLATGLVIPIGLQTVPALVLAFLLKANKVLSWTFTCVTNPATIFFIYPIQCYIGSLIIFHPMSLTEMNQTFNNLVQAKSMLDAIREFMALGSSIIIPFFAGGILFAVIAAPAGYFLSYKLVVAYRKRKEMRRLKKENVQKQ